MHFPFSSCPSATARFVVLAFPLLFCCVIWKNYAAKKIDTHATNDTSPPTFTTVPDGPLVEKFLEMQDTVGDGLTQVSYDVTDSPTDTVVSETEITVAATATDIDDSAGVEFTFDYTTEETDSRWMQKIRRIRPSVNESKSLRVPEDVTSAFKSPGNPMSLSQVIFNILYGPAWPATHVNYKCYEDMKLYNLHIQNSTLWATKSKL